MKKTIPILLICLFCINWLSSQNCRLSCVSSVNVSLMPNDCQDTLSPLSFLNNPSAISPSCLAYKLVILYPFGTQKFSPANVVNQSHAGYTMKYQVFDSVSKNSCWGYLKVNKCNPCLIPTPPVVTSFTITPPAGPYPINGTIQLDATATDNISIVKVDFYDGPALLRSDPSFPYSATYITTAYKTYNFRAIAYDNCGRKDTSDIISITTALPTCSDGVKNGSETGTDCGGVNCAPCPPPPPATCDAPVSLTSGTISSQSSTYYSYSASKARDASTYTYSLTNAQLQPWWQLDLGAQFVVSKVEIKHRSCYGCNSYLIRDNFFISASPFSSDINVVKADPAIYEFGYIATNMTLSNINIKGRYLRIWRENSSPNSLSLLDVKVTGCPMIMPLAGITGSLNSTGNTTKSQVVNIYPNPSTDKLYIATDNGQFNEGEAILTDFSGRTVMNKKISDAEIDIRALEPGYYILKLNVNGLNSVHKVLKN